MLLTCRRLDRRDDLARHAQLGERTERGQAVVAKIADSLVEPDHAFLHDILPISADEEVRARLRANEVAILVDQVVQSNIAATLLDSGNDLFIRQSVKSFEPCIIAAVSHFCFHSIDPIRVLFHF